MNVTYEKRQELNKLSKELYGRTSTWVKIYHRGLLTQGLNRPNWIKNPKVKYQERIFLNIEQIEKLMINKLEERNNVSDTSS